MSLRTWSWTFRRYKRYSNTLVPQAKIFQLISYKFWHYSAVKPASLPNAFSYQKSSFFGRHLFLSFVSRLSRINIWKNPLSAGCLPAGAKLGQPRGNQGVSSHGRQVELILCDRKKLKSSLTKTIKNYFLANTQCLWGAVICNRPFSIIFSLTARPRGHKKRNE